MRELTDQQRLFLIESEQILAAWRAAYWQKQLHQYGMKWVRAGGRDYLVRLRDARGNGKSLGPRSTETERIHFAFTANKQRADERFAALSAALKQQARLNKAVRLGRLPALIGRILHALDLARAEHHFTVIGTHALYAYEAMAAVQCSMDLLASGDVDLFYDPRKPLALTAEKLDGIGLLGLLRKVDPSFEIVATHPFRAVKQERFLVDLVIFPEGMRIDCAVRFAEDDWVAAEVPSLQWLLNSPRVEVTVIATDGRPVLMRLTGSISTSVALPAQDTPRNPHCRHASYRAIATALARLRLRPVVNIGIRNRCSRGMSASTRAGRPRVSGPNSSASSGW